MGIISSWLIVASSSSSRDGNSASFKSSFSTIGVLVHEFVLEINKPSQLHTVRKVLASHLAIENIKFGMRASESVDFHHERKASPK